MLKKYKEIERGQMWNLIKPKQYINPFPISIFLSLINRELKLQNKHKNHFSFSSLLICYNSNSPQKYSHFQNAVP